MPRTLKYRLYPNRKQRETLATQLDLCRELYNAALQERIESYKTTGKGVTWLQQQAQLPAIKEVRPEFKSVHAHTLQAVLIRLSQTCVCGAKVPKRLADREHVCIACGWMASRDHVSAQVILERARTVPSSANVGEVMPCVA